MPRQRKIRESTKAKEESKGMLLGQVRVQGKPLRPRAKAKEDKKKQQG